MIGYVHFTSGGSYPWAPGHLMASRATMSPPYPREAAGAAVVTRWGDVEAERRADEDVRREAVLDMRATFSRNVDDLGKRARGHAHFTLS